MDVESRSASSAFAQRVLSATGIIVGVALLLLLIGTQAHALLLVFGAILFGILLTALSEVVERYTPLGSAWALGLILVVLLGLAALGGWLAAPYVTHQFYQLQSDLPRYLEKLQERIVEFMGGKEFLNEIPEPSEVLQKSDTVIGGVTTFFSTTFGFLFDVIIILILGVYFAFDPRVYTNGVLQLFPPDRRARLADVLEETGRKLRWWLIGRLLAMVLVGFLTGIGLWLLGLRLALALGILAGLFTFVPYVGAILAYVPIALVAMPSGGTTFLFVTVLYGGIQSLEGYLFTPLIQQRVVSMPPALTLISQLMFGLLLGGIGVVFATPLVAAGLVFVQRLYIEEVVEADPETPQLVT